MTPILDRLFAIRTIQSKVGHLILALVVACLVALLYPPIWAVADDTTILAQAQAHGLAALFWTYSGYFGLAQRAVSLVEAPNPILIGALGSYVAVALVALFLVRRVHPIAVIALLLAPAVSVYGTLSNIQWVLAVYLIAMLVATPPTSARGRMLDAAGIFVCGLTGPFSMLLLALYAIRAVNPVWRLHVIVLAGAAAIQLTAFAVSFRPPAPDHDLLAVLVARAAIPLGLIIITALWLPLRWVGGALYVAAVVVALGVVGTLHTTAELLAGAGERYFYLPWVLGIGMVALATMRRTHDFRTGHAAKKTMNAPTSAIT